MTIQTTPSDHIEAQEAYHNLTRESVVPLHALLIGGSDRMGDEWHETCELHQGRVSIPIPMKIFFWETTSGLRGQ
jgi:hypothetical protein